MLIPLGLDDGRLTRVPWASLGVVAACTLLHLLPAARGHDRAALDLCLVTGRGVLQHGWLTAPFAHADWSHLLWNLFYLLLSAPFLESVVGHRTFLAFYLAAGALASAPTFAALADQRVHMLGASGAISACLGAFAWRFRRRRVRLLWSWSALALRPTFTVPAWAWALGGLAGDALWFSLLGHRAGVGYGVHVTGFLLGALAALLAGHLGVEDRLLAREGGWRRSEHLARAEAALAAGRADLAERHLRAALAERPADPSARLMLAELAVGAGRLDEALAQLERLAGAASVQPDALRELVAAVGLHRLRPATALLLAGRLEPTDHLLALDLADAAVAAGGRLGAQALVAGAELALRHRELHAALARATAALGAPELAPEHRARAAAVAAAAGARLELRLEGVG